MSEFIKQHKNGSIWAKGQIVDDEMHGYWEWFRKDGSIMRSGSFDRGRQTGEWTTYDAGGKVVKVTKKKSMPVIRIEVTVSLSVQQVWEFWSKPEHITKWNYAGDDWHCPTAVNDLKPGGRFSSRMEAKDESFGFDFGGTYQEVEVLKRITSVLDDKRTVHVNFSEVNGETRIVQTFEAEGENTLELQQMGWQMILNNFRKYAGEYSEKCVSPNSLRQI
jgi:uncharacterized protein YndB with AHSA1/START domain